MVTKSSFSLLTISDTLVYAVTPYLAANSLALFSSESQTAVNADPDMEVHADAWIAATFPHPIMPDFSFSLMNYIFMVLESLSEDLFPFYKVYRNTKPPQRVV